MDISKHVTIQNHGSIVLVCPESDAAREWIKENVATESWQWIGGALACEPRYVEPFVSHMLQDLEGNA